MWSTTSIVSTSSTGAISIAREAENNSATCPYADLPQLAIAAKPALISPKKSPAKTQRNPLPTIIKIIKLTNNHQ